MWLEVCWATQDLFRRESVSDGFWVTYGWDWPGSAGSSPRSREDRSASPPPSSSSSSSVL
jgi:hypothetical protein